MGKRDLLSEIPSTDIDMTPMIDVVFQLLIFFMLVNQMVQEERSQLELPWADQAQEEKAADKKRLIINVDKDGIIAVSGKKVTPAELTKLLFEEAKSSKDNKGISDRSVLIRGDISTHYSHIQKVLIECAQQKIYKISFAAQIPEK